ncbi:MAG: hypothetical protein KatS3mg109_2311 [Pirellulaceae bacterium]|nr:MAG: hypothetical protein KatS3mg109_2311 [Pirellulaceae bacterium]
MEGSGCYWPMAPTLDTETLIWAAGVKCNPVPGLPEHVYGKANRLFGRRVHNRLQGFENIFVIGDQALMKTKGLSRRPSTSSYRGHSAGQAPGQEPPPTATGKPFETIPLSKQRGRWLPLAATGPWPTCRASISTAFSPGYCGCSFT